MAFSSDPCHQGKSYAHTASGKPASGKSRSGKGRAPSRLGLYATLLSGIAVASGSLWMALTSNAPSYAMVHAAPGDSRPRIALVERLPVPRPAEGRADTARTLDGATLARHYNRERVAAALSPEEKQLQFAEIGAEEQAKRARVVRYGGARQDPRHLDILRRAIAASGETADKKSRVAFLPGTGAGSGLKIRATMAGPAPAPESSIEIAFMAPAASAPVQVAKAEPAAPSTSVPKRGDPFETVLASVETGAVESFPDDIDVPLPATRPSRPADSPLPMKARSTPQRGSGTELAYARPQNPLKEDEPESRGFSLFGRKPTMPGPGSRIAVYDISAGLVYMPNGEKLEAHSGRGSMRDDPRYAHIKNRGPTPPHIYNLRMREQRFHGVEAIRMLPYDGQNKFGRDGFLTHTYLLRVRGDSSGCVVFEEYPRFLNAFKRGEVNRLIVVPKLAELPKYMAAL